jgi:hypothetical protein
MWTGRKIIKELTDGELRRRVLTAFWRYGDAPAKAMAVAQLAKALHFREESLRKMPIEKKADLLASKIQMPEMEHPLEMALMHYHTHEANTMLAAFLDRWSIAHENGEITAEDYPAPSAEQVRDAARELSGQFPRKEIALYLAAAGLLMGEEWRKGAWPVVDEMVSQQ